MRWRETEYFPLLRVFSCCAAIFSSPVVGLELSKDWGITIHWRKRCHNLTFESRSVEKKTKPSAFTGQPRSLDMTLTITGKKKNVRYGNFFWLGEFVQRSSWIHHSEVPFRAPSPIRQIIYWRDRITILIFCRLAAVAFLIKFALIEINLRYIPSSWYIVRPMSVTFNKTGVLRAKTKYTKRQQQIRRTSPQWAHLYTLQSLPVDFNFRCSHCSLHPVLPGRKYKNASSYLC